MSRLLTLRQAVIDHLKAVLPEGWDVAGHLGRFTPNDITRFFTVAPAVRVAILGLSDTVVVDADAIETRVRLAVYVVTKDRAAVLGREAIAAAAVETIVLLAHGQRWGLAFCRPALPATAQTIFNDETLSKGVALWGIDIPQPAVLAREEAALTPIDQLYLGLAPDIGPDHVADYIGPIAVQGELPGA